MYYRYMNFVIVVFDVFDIVLFGVDKGLIFDQVY